MTLFADLTTEILNKLGFKFSSSGFGVKTYVDKKGNIIFVNKDEDSIELVIDDPELEKRVKKALNLK